MKCFMPFVILSLLACACSSGSGEHKKLVGGCETDTILLGLALKSPEGRPARPVRLDILSIENAGKDIYVSAAADLRSVLDSIGIEIAERSELIHIKSGACWPPYRITHIISGPEDEGLEILREAILEKGVAGMPALEKRPPGYGKIFITCGRGSRDLWTIWFDSE